MHKRKVVPVLMLVAAGYLSVAANTGHIESRPAPAETTALNSGGQHMDGVQAQNEVTLTRIVIKRLSPAGSNSSLN
jgi:hypothetical protein